MKGPELQRPGAIVADYLREAVESEVLPVFRASSSPKLPDADVRGAVRLLFELLDLRLDDPSLAEVGPQILSGLSSNFRDEGYTKISDRFEPFAKLVLKVTRPKLYADLAAKHPRGVNLGAVLQECRLAEEKEIRASAACPWQSFPPAGLRGKPDFKEQLGWTYRFRNTEDHLAPELSRVQQATVVESVCVCFVWLVAKFTREIQAALLRTRFSEYLRRVRDDQTRTALAAKGIELTVHPRSAEEYRVANPLLPVVNAPSVEEELGVFKVPEANRVTVIEGEVGAGKTTALELIAWREAHWLLHGGDQTSRLPIPVRLKACQSSIASQVEEGLRLGQPRPPQVPWESLLLLIDGLNEVSAEVQSRFQAEIQDLLQRHPGLRLIVTGRLNSVRGEYPAAIVQLQPLSDERLGELISKVAPDGERVRAIMAAIRRTPGLLALARTPFYAATLASLAETEDLATLTSRATVVRACIQRFLHREETQTSAGVTRTKPRKKELLLARLAFETKSAGESAFSQSRAQRILEASKEQLAPRLDVLDFIEELVVNHVLERLPNGRVAFAHDIYQDYFSACKLEEDEGLSERAGVGHALDRFTDRAWEGCIRLFAELADRSRVLIEAGAERNPALAWSLLDDGGIEDADLRENVAGAAYCALTTDLADPGKADTASTCLLVLAALGQTGLLVRAVKYHKSVLEPADFWKLSEEQKQAETKKIQAALAPLGYGLISVLRLGVLEQGVGRGGPFLQAGRELLPALKEIEAAEILVAILQCWTGRSFEPSLLVPGLVLDALIELGVDAVVGLGIPRRNLVLAQWLSSASEADYSKAWPAYGRLLRLARPEASRDWARGVTYEPKESLRWLRMSHEAGDRNGSRELALLLLEDTSLAETPAEGEQLLRRLAQTDLESRCELGLRLIKGEDLCQDQAEGLGELISAAEAGHRRSVWELKVWLATLWVFEPSLHLAVPPWAMPFAERLHALFPSYPLTSRV